MGTSDWRSEAQSAVQHERWKLTGPDRVVKVVPLSWDPLPSVGGYITLARFLLGKTPSQIEGLLGLRPEFLSSGACVYTLARLPNPSEYEHELTAEFPGGLAFNPGHGDELYPSGNSKTHQWQIKPGISIAVNPSMSVRLHPDQRFPY